MNRNKSRMSAFEGPWGTTLGGNFLALAPPSLLSYPLPANLQPPAGPLPLP